MSNTPWSNLLDEELEQFLHDNTWCCDKCDAYRIKAQRLKVRLRYSQRHVDHLKRQLAVLNRLLAGVSVDDVSPVAKKPWWRFW